MQSSNTMTFGSSTFLVAVGAILRYAITVEGDGFDIGMIGAILMIAGLAGFVVSFAMLATSRRSVTVAPAAETTIVETEIRG